MASIATPLFVLSDSDSLCSALTLYRNNVIGTVKKYYGNIL